MQRLAPLDTNRIYNQYQQHNLIPMPDFRHPVPAIARMENLRLKDYVKNLPPGLFFLFMKDQSS